MLINHKRHNTVNSMHQTKNCSHILMVEDNPTDALLFSEMLHTAFDGQYSVICVDRFEKIDGALSERSYHALILDMDLPDRSGVDNVFQLGQLFPSLPIVVLTGNENLDQAITSLKYGAQEYLSKNKATPEVLGRSVHYAIERKLIELKLKQALDKIAHKNKQLVEQANHDSLTGLPNRSYFEDIAKRILLRAKRKKHKVGLLFFDLNGFKQINDTYGHYVGDKLLKQVSDRLKREIRDSDFLARIGGDEFVIITDLLENKQEVYPLINRIQNQFKIEFVIEGLKIQSECSIGVSFFPDAANLDTLIKHADFAMYEAKSDTDSYVCFYSEKLATQFQREQVISTLLGRASKNSELIAHFQPMICHHKQDEIHVEVLARWHSSPLGDVPPSEFIPVAEQSPTIDDITHAVTIHCGDFNKAIQDSGLNIDRLSFNVSTCQIIRQDFCELFLQWLHNYNLPPNVICLEVAESHALQNTERYQRQFEFLKESGIRIGLDDFGSGFSYITHLPDLPLDYLKLDRLLISDIDTNPRNQAIVAGIVETAHRLDMEIIAEGIETKAEKLTAINLGCDYLQGYFISKPLLIHEATEYFTK